MFARHTHVFWKLKPHLTKIICNGWNKSVFQFVFFFEILISREKYIHSSTKRGSKQPWQYQDFESFCNGHPFFKSRKCPVLPNGNFFMKLSRIVCGTKEFPKVFAIFASELEMINAFSKPATQILCLRNVSWIWNWIACKLLKDYKDAVLIF